MPMWVAKYLEPFIKLIANHISVVWHFILLRNVTTEPHNMCSIHNCVYCSHYYRFLFDMWHFHVYDGWLCLAYVRNSMLESESDREREYEPNRSSLKRQVAMAILFLG